MTKNEIMSIVVKYFVATGPADAEHENYENKITMHKIQNFIFSLLIPNKNKFIPTSLSQPSMGCGMSSGNATSSSIPSSGNNT